MSLIVAPLAHAEGPPDVRPSSPRAPTSDEPTAQGDTKHLPQEVGAGRPDRAEHAEMMSQLWLTPLGKMFRHFLFETDPTYTPSELSHQIIDRIHSDVRMVLTRSTALSMMKEDLYNTAELTPVSHGRIALLDMGLDVRRIAAQNNSANEYMKFLPLFIVTGLAAGSPLVREKVTGVGKDLWAMVRATFGRGSMETARRSLRQHVGPGELFSRRLIRNYTLIPALAAFQFVFTYGYLVYYVARTGSADAIPVQNKVWVYSLQRLVNFDEI